jgi:hypothetical protein
VSVLDEEQKALLRRILERTACRQIMVANIRGHGLKYVLDVAEKSLLVRDLEAALELLRHVEAFYRELDGEELELAVRDAMDRVPYPYSRLELAVCLSLVGRAERLVASTYLESSSAGMASIARRIHDLERPGTRMLEMQLADFCAEPGNRPTAQQFVNRWPSGVRARSGTSVRARSDCARRASTSLSARSSPRRARGARATTWRFRTWRPWASTSRPKE